MNSGASTEPDWTLLGCAVTHCDYQVKGSALKLGDTFRTTCVLDANFLEYQDGERMDKTNRVRACAIRFPCFCEQVIGNRFSHL